MQHTETEVQTPAPVSISNETKGVFFDTDRLIITGFYSDEIGAYRAKKTWSLALEQSFLLDSGHDFKVKVVRNMDAALYELRCEFTTACGRYAFWRLTHNQAPETQFLMEHAHRPSLNPDSYPMVEDDEEGIPFVQGYGESGHRPEWRNYIKSLLTRIFNRS